MKNNRICDILNIKKPIIQAPMVWICSPELVVGVCEAGGLGTLGINGGYDTMATSLEETAERTRASVRKIKSKTDKPFAINYMMPIEAMGQSDGEYNEFSEATINVAIEEGVKIVVAVGNADVEKIKEFKSKGLTVIYRPLIPTVEAVQKAEAAGADIIVATGIDEGGSAPINPIGTFSIVPIISDAVSVPVMAAGGVVDARGVNAAFALGAEGVFVGTAFIPTVEGPSHDKCKQAIVDAESTDTIATLVKTGYMRALRTPSAEHEYNKFVNRITDGEEYVIGERRIGPLETYIHGNLEEGEVSVNAAVSLIKKVKTCQEVIDGLFPEV